MKLVLIVVDAMKPAMLERAIAAGQAPAMARIRAEGAYVPDCAAAFPSVDRKSTRLNSSHSGESRMPSSA